MRLHSPRFEKALRRSVKRTVRSSRELKREFRRANRFRRNSRIGWIFRPVFAVLLGLAVGAATATTGHAATGLAIINLWMLGSLSILAQAFWTRLHRSSDLGALALLPISRERIFRWQSQKFFHHSLFSLFDLLVSFGVLAAYYDFPPAKWAVAFLAAVLSWVTLLALAAFCAARLPKAPFQIISAGLILTGLVVFFGRQYIWPMVLKAIDASAPGLNLLLPVGWPGWLFQVMLPGHPWWMLVLLLPVAAIIWTTKDSLRRLFEGFQYRELVLPETSDLVPGEAPVGKAAPGRPVHLGATAIEEIIQTRKFLGPPQWPQHGWMEQQLWGWFDRRERTLSDFTFPGGLAITAPWLKTFRNFGIAAAIALVAGLIGPNFKFGVLGIGLFITVCQALAQILNHGRAFRTLGLSGVNIPIYAGFGIGFDELSRLLFKCAFVQIPFLMTFTLAAGMITAALAGFPLEAGMIFGLKFGFLLFFSRFIFVTCAFSSGTNDTSRFRFRAVLLLFLIVVLGFGFAGLGGAGLFVPQGRAAGLLCLGAAADAYAFFWIYKWFYNSGRFDLMSLPRR